MLIRTCLVLLLIASYPVDAESELIWRGQQINVGKGTVIEAGDALLIQAEADGKVFISVDLQGRMLEGFSRVGIEFRDPPVEGQFFVAWRTGNGAEGMRQFWLPGRSGDSVSVLMAEEANWSGAGVFLGLGVILPPYGSVSINSISLFQPTFIGEMIESQRQQLREWSAFRPWKPADVNIHTGTAAAGSGETPVKFFARLLLVALLGYLIYLVARSRIRRFNWNIAGVLVLVCWIGLDLLWQIRLSRQVTETYVTFAGKSSSEKLMASDDAPFVRFINRAKDSISGDSPRIFLASASDYGAMVSAYYIAPLNTYWHRKGPELPDRKFLTRGDYILLVSPFTTQYQPAQNTITLPDASQLPVELVLRERMGALLRVI